ncbi:MAG: SGNH/GDSL hydrolase family protein [Devosia sp.]|nr:SGNH/GDSL hydrolase family protein [Devosia sp.]
MPPVRTILCFGDSNTYGAVPTLTRGGGHRFAPDRRWPGVMRRQLGSGWEVIEEGHPSRTTVRDDPIEGSHKNGLKALPILLESHMPIDLVILMLGTNDLKHRFASTASDIADSIEILVRTIQRSEAGPAGAEPALIVVAPAPMQEVDRFADMFLGGARKSLQLAGFIRDVAKRTGASFVDAGTLVESSSVDGIHLDSDAHRILGLELARVVHSLMER